MYRRPAITRLTLLSVAGILAPCAVYAAADLKSLHHDREIEQCSTCHTQGDFAGLDLQRGCANCHEDGERGGPLKTPAAAGGKAMGGKDDPLGLAGPMYYEDTRIGAAPGPMVRIPAGEFRMGSDDRLADEGPQHTVRLPDYDLDEYEVTNLQYQAFIEATGRRAPDDFENRAAPRGKADHPVTFVTWFDARDYCAWAGKRLPTEQEWEKAARGADARIFPWGDEFDIRAANTPVRWARLGREGDTTPVGAFKAGVSPYGLYDMSGNVWEWTASWYLPHPGNTTKSENFGQIYKVLKGGSWWDCSFYKCGISAPTFNRSFFNARVKNSSFGFRCAKNVEDGR
ncbi:MAG: formylglycine-generating enzyme family protein [Gammaproteobacteria bacterium]|nr:formylglycine-generating enzyme family protein [Gammaproteobacteria bacterium]